ncbi:hypothetical protein [Loigolactobacillus backii]|uniref:Uncharacterized protein n=1 Tax=Loigolactobacillus backii TaxID=375175 RepID=A0A192H5C1_9LACO|nr:hypothetical protein [Loigolactobacillus backii]ANK59775.1 hypothetical protein AYR52_05590 [Loigolactobacillus backii]ANK63176.1 hypothetical protein AYR53_10610 [Loigolactobacillus backii]ANK64770.1 hypothetical protein AYR54_05610 [Loigolactobacillus backii]ANK66781.1 hypothetical protein AYR55_03135 [Loigolactobacillus backii]ANK69818.1 hypothetical protein AYR56_06395 [Loigolactobacillus backii]
MLRLAMALFALVLLVLAYYLHRHLTRTFLMHDLTQDKQLHDFVKRYRNYFGIVGGLTLISLLIPNLTLWVVLLILGCLLAAIFALSLANHL